MKKESARRGYMNSDEVDKHLKPFSGSLEGSGAKVGYINKALAKSKLLHPLTKANLRRNLARIHNDSYRYVDADLALIENGGEDYQKGIADLKTRKDNPKAAEALAKYNEFEAAAGIYAQIGYGLLNRRSSSDIDFEGVRKNLTKAAELYEKVGKLDDAAHAIIRSNAGIYSGDASDSIKYGALLQKAAEQKDENQLDSKVQYFKEAQERFQKAGKTAKALAIGKKLGPLEEKLEAEKKRRGYAVVSIAGVLGSLFFLSSNVTGNAISNLTNVTSSFIGAGLLIIGIVAGAFALKSKIR